MSDTGSKKVKHNKKTEISQTIKLWDGIVEYEEPPGDARTERVRAAIDRGLLKFEQHKNPLIAILRGAYDRGPKSEPFDEVRSWLRLTNLAGTYHWEAEVANLQMDRTDRKARLRVLAKAIGKARGLIEGAIRDDIGNDFFSAWCENTDEPRTSVVRNDQGTLSMAQTAERSFKNATQSVAALETAALRASRAAHGERVGGGRPKGTSVLPHGYITVLANIYEGSTGMKPQTGDGPFGRLVLGFLAAIDRELSERRVFEIIEDALKPNP